MCRLFALSANGWLCVVGDGLTLNDYSICLVWTQNWQSTGLCSTMVQDMHKAPIYLATSFASSIFTTLFQSSQPAIALASSHTLQRLRLAMVRLYKFEEIQKRTKFLFIQTMTLTSWTLSSRLFASPSYSALTFNAAKDTLAVLDTGSHFNVVTAVDTDILRYPQNSLFASVLHAARAWGSSSLQYQFL